uniref:Putative secreted protein n=1 Tax=Ixodes ricinus TaxID=34613 RepID=A0A6B0U347_IXORI
MVVTVQRFVLVCVEICLVPDTILGSLSLNSSAVKFEGAMQQFFYFQYVPYNSSLTFITYKICVSIFSLSVAVAEKN